jgi:hypothetical protein
LNVFALSQPSFLLLSCSINGSIWAQKIFPGVASTKGNVREWIADALATVWQTVFLAASPVGDGRG